MQTIRVYCKNPQDVFAALQTKFKARNWKASCRMVHDGSISITCQDSMALCQVETFLDMIISDEYQTVDE